LNGLSLPSVQASMNDLAAAVAPVGVLGMWLAPTPAVPSLEVEPPQLIARLK
jgi:hypothetical protein